MKVENLTFRKRILSQIARSNRNGRSYVSKENKRILCQLSIEVLERGNNIVHTRVHIQIYVHISYTELDAWWTSRGAVVAVEPTRFSPVLGHSRWAIVAVLVLIAVTAGFWWLRPSARERTALKPVPLTSYPGHETYPSFSPDASQVAFSWNGEKQDNFDIYVKVVGSGSPLRVTTDSHEDVGPAWSPNGRSIAFIRRQPDHTEVLLAAPLGGDMERKLAEIYLPGTGFWGRLGHFLSWSPDGRWLAVNTADSPQGAMHLILISAETGEMRTLTPLDPQITGDVSPTFSPDGRTLAFSRVTNTLHSEIYLLDLSSGLEPRGNPRQLTFEGRITTAPVWTADGRGLIFISGANPSTMRVWQIPASGGTPRIVEFGYIGVNHVARAGSRLVFSYGTGDIDIWRVELPAGGNSPGSQAAPPARLISSSRPDGNPQFSPDGNRIVFQSLRSGSPEVYVSNRDGSGAVQLTSLGGPSVANPRWSPDGKHIAFAVSIEGSVQIYTMDAGGGAPRLIQSDPSAEALLNWSRDGNWIYFPSRRSGQAQSWKAPVGGGAPVQVTTNGGYSARESPDGKFVYYLHGTPLNLWRIPITGGSESLVMDRVGNFCDFVDAGLYCLKKPDPRSPALLEFFSFEAGAVRNIAEISPQQINGFTVSPDGRTFVYAQSESRGGVDLMLVDNFY